MSKFAWLINNYSSLPSGELRSAPALISDINGERYPDIAVEVHSKNQRVRTACMKFLLSLIEMLPPITSELSNEDLVEANVALTCLKNAGFKVDWLEKNLDQVKEKKEKKQVQASVTRAQKLEKELNDKKPKTEKR